MSSCCAAMARRRSRIVAPGSGGLRAPTGLVFGPGGDLYVSSALTDQVLRYEGATGAFIDAFVSGGSANTGVRFPVDLVFGSDAHLYVSSFENNRVQRYDGQTGAFISSFASGHVSGPAGLVFGPGRAANLYVSATKTDRVVRFDGTTGAFVDSFVDNGSGGLSAPHFLIFLP